MTYPPPAPAVEPPLTLPYYGCPPQAAVTRLFRNYTNFKGRASQQEYWWVLAAVVAVGVVLGIIASIMVAATASSRTFGQVRAGLGAMGLLWGLFALLALAVVVPVLALGFRRCQDANIPGVMALLQLIPGLGIVAVVGIALLRSQPGAAHFDADGGVAAAAAGLGYAGPPPTSYFPESGAFGTGPAAPPAPGYQQPPAGYQQPPPGYHQPPAAPPGYQQSQAAPPGYQQPPAAPPGYQPPPAAPQAAPPGYGPPPTAAPPGYGPPPTAAPPGYGQPPGPPLAAPPGYQQPPAAPPTSSPPG